MILTDVLICALFALCFALGTRQARIYREQNKAVLDELEHLKRYLEVIDDTTFDNKLKINAVRGKAEEALQRIKEENIK